ncbi:MAG TPA: hypothetical protein VKY74_19565 [Chloroflexia bacterium]|nr:hypothetical protein [Chloroflexia bacterium]
MRIYLTHCSAKKDPRYRISGQLATPAQLYTATPTQRFMKVCQRYAVNWAIFSDRYGVWFPDVARAWYEKHPKHVSDEEFAILLEGFDRDLAPYEEIWFYHNPGRFHSVYQHLLEETRLRERVRKFTHLHEIR